MSTHFLNTFSWLGVALLALAACDDGEIDPMPTDAGVEAPRALTYHADTRAIIETKCATCHQPGNIAPFPLQTHEQVQTFAGAMRYAIEAGTMPPWQAGEDCRSYDHDFSLTPDEKDTLLAWIDAGAEEGDPATYEAPPAPAAGDDMREDLVVTLPAYTPQKRPDDYRCLLVEWPEGEDAFVTGFRFDPDQLQMVHHIIVFAAEPEDADIFRAMDAEEEGPGYTCFGGPNRTGSEAPLVPAAHQLQAWAPGVVGGKLPAGTGLRVTAGTLLIAQVHYNTSSSEPVADESTITFELEPEVERPAVFQLVADPVWLAPGGMHIAAGEPDVEHRVDLSLGQFLRSRVGAIEGVDIDGPLAVHRVGMHMHTLGQSSRMSIQRADGDEECLLDLPQWDFNWQGDFRLAEPAILQPDDMLRVRCTFDNSAENQPFIDGAQVAPQDVEWGEGTRDEMCLGVLYISAP